MVEKKYYLLRDGELWFNDSVLVIDGDDFRRKSLHYVHLGEKATRVGEATFEGNYLTQIHFHKKIKWIGKRSFADNKIEKIIFSRLEVPEIEKDAFSGNPVSLIIVPYETLEDYKKVLGKVEFDQPVEIKSNIEIKFKRLNEEYVEGTVIMIKAFPIYGSYIWRIEKEEITDLETKMKKDENQYDFGEIILNDVSYNIYKDGHGNVFVYRKKNDQYIDVTFGDFETIYNDARKALL